MAADNILKEFLVSIGFKLDEAKLKATSNAIESSLDHTSGGVTKTLSGLATAAEGSFAAVAGVVTAAAAAFTGAFFAIDHFVDAISKRFETLYYSSQRAGSSMANMTAIMGAASRTGFEGIGGMIEQFGLQLKYEPGKARGLLPGLGVGVQGRDPTEVFMDLMDRLTKMPPYVAEQYGRMFNISRQQLEQWRAQGADFRKEFVRQQQVLKGVDWRKEEERFKDYQLAVKDFNSAMRVIGIQIAVAATPALTRFYKFLSHIAAQMEKNGKLQGLFDTLEKALEKLINYAATIDWDKAIKGVMDFATKAVGYIKQSVDELGQLIEVFKNLQTTIHNFIESLPDPLKKALMPEKPSAIEEAARKAGYIKEAPVSMKEKLLYGPGGKSSAKGGMDILSDALGMKWSPAQLYKRWWDWSGGLGKAKVSPQALQQGQKAAEQVNKWSDLISKYSEQYGVDPNLVAAVMQQESRGNPNAISPTGAQGLMQFTRGTAKEVGITNRLDPEQSIAGGAKYLSQLLARSHGDVAQAIGRYYGLGPHKVGPSTEQYVSEVMTKYLARQHLGGDGAMAMARPSSSDLIMQRSGLQSGTTINASINVTGVESPQVVANLVDQKFQQMARDGKRQGITRRT